MVPLLHNCAANEDLREDSCCRPRDLSSSASSRSRVCLLISGSAYLVHDQLLEGCGAGVADVVLAQLREGVQQVLLLPV